MSDKKVWGAIAAGGLLVAGVFGYLVQSEKKSIEESGVAVATLRTQIDKSRSTIRGTPDLEREVIVLREIAERIREVLPDTKDLNDLIRNFQDYSRETGVRPSSFKPKDAAKDRARGKASSAFEKVAYTLTLEADLFQFLEFLNRIETHRRFMSVNSFKIDATTRRKLEEDGVASHRVTMEVETYKYVPRSTDAQEVRIEGYERKRDLLAGEINRRRQALTLATYQYRGPRGRRDPLIDPRVPARVDDPDAWTVQRQMEEVDELIRRLDEARAFWDASKAAESVLDRMVQRSELEKTLALLEEDMRRIDTGNKVSYKPAEKRLQLSVVEPLAALRAELESSRAIAGPSREALEQVGGAMERHILAGEYEAALDAYKALASGLDLIQRDPPREELADWLRQLAFDAETLRDFAKIKLEIGGYAIIEDNPPVVIINGRSRTIGDPVGNELLVHAIHPAEVDFVFRKVILTRQY
ncbi:MAG: type 4a pilus biogenesis protein PilO [Planctomycetota bacterium]